MKFVSFLLLGMAVAAPVNAQVTPVIFARENVRIAPPPPTANEADAVILRDGVSYDTEVRSEEALQLEYIHTLNMLSDATGVMIVFAAPSIVSLPRMQVQTPVDAIFIAEDGTILQMLPNVVLADITQDIAANNPVKAFLFLQAGQIKSRLIKPHDVVSGTMFIPAPAVIQ